VYSYQFATTVAQVQSQASSCGICGEKNGIGADFLSYSAFPSLRISSAAPHSIIILSLMLHGFDIDGIIK
jgi:hypothetical protein